MEEEVDLVVRQRRGRRQVFQDDPGPNLDESDDENVSNAASGRNAAQGLAAMLEDGEDTDSALDELDDDQQGGDQGKEQEGRLDRLPPRWKNLIVRGCSGLLLISGFSFLVYLGTSGLLFLTFLVVTSSYSEVTRLAFKVTGASKATYGKLVWAWYIISMYFLHASYAWHHLSTSSPTLAKSFPFLTDVVSSILFRQHQLICFTAYVTTFIAFVLKLDTNYIKSYALFAWCHTFMLLICSAGFLMNASTFNGLIWYVLPMSLITLNDIAAFYVGYFFGRTPLIKLSPKKTVEGFIGGGLLTVILGCLLCHWLTSMPSFICPVVTNDPLDFISGRKVLFEVQEQCDLADMFKQGSIQIGSIMVTTCPFVYTHGMVLSLLCSLVGPFGGFFASGFKRACKRKNFGGFIPGHGGVTDRCDCMFMCAAIIGVYYQSFIKETI